MYPRIGVFLKSSTLVQYLLTKRKWVLDREAVGEEHVKHICIIFKSSYTRSYIFEEVVTKGEYLFAINCSLPSVWIQKRELAISDSLCTGAQFYYKSDFKKFPATEFEGPCSSQNHYYTYKDKFYI